VKKRGLPEGYVRGLEKLWGLAIRDVDAVEDNVLMALAGDDDSRKPPSRMKRKNWLAMLKTQRSFGSDSKLILSRRRKPS
jgi:hypothetical protein